MRTDRSRGRWLAGGLGLLGLLGGWAALGGLPTARAADAADRPGVAHEHCTVCGEHLQPVLPRVERYQLHNAVVSLDRRNRSDDDHNAYRNVLRLDTQTGRAWILRPNDNVAGFSWVLVPNYN